jgi:hypothetical protein
LPRACSDQPRRGLLTVFADDADVVAATGFTSSSLLVDEAVPGLVAAA